MQRLHQRAKIVDLLPENGACEAIVVGAGLSGLQLAVDLCRVGGKNVTILEAGRDHGTRHINLQSSRTAALKTWQLFTPDPSFYRGWTPDNPPHYALNAGQRRRVGGRSLYWHGVVLPMEPWALRQPWWPGRVVSDLTVSYAGGEPLFSRCLKEIGVCESSHASRWLAALLRSGGYAQTVPVPQALTHSERDGEPRWSAYSPLDYWTHPALANQVPNLPDIVQGAEVISLITANRRVTGIMCRDPATQTPREVRCSTVTLAAGAVENTRLVMDALVDNGLLDTQRLGGLCDHVGSGVLLRFKLTDVPPELISSSAGAFVMTPGSSSERSNTFVNITLEQDQRTIQLEAWGMGEQLPDPRNAIYRAHDGLHITATLSDADTIMLASQQQTLHEVVSWLLAQLPIPGAVRDALLRGSDLVSISQAMRRLVDASDDEPLSLRYVSPLGTTNHEGCTLPVGQVLSDHGQVLGIDGLYVVGPSTFPRLGAANPSLTTLALAKRTANLID